MSLVTVLIISFLIGTILFALILKFKKKIFYIYQNYNTIQKIHEGYVPPLGGFVIFTVFFIGIYLLNTSTFIEKEIVIGSLLILIIGLIEDFSGKVSPLIRFLVIFLASIIYTISKENLPHIEIPIIYWLLSNIPFFEIIFFSICLTTVSNGLNMIDGVNGLAGLNAISILIAIFSILILNNNADLYLN